MDLVGAWVRQLLRAGTAAAIVPVAMVGALIVVLVGAGGFGGLGALRQVVSGPQIAPTQIAEAGPEAPAVAPPARRPRRRAAPPAARRPAARAPAPAAPAATAPPVVRPRPPAPPPPPPPVAVAPPPPVADVPPPPPEQVATPDGPPLEQATQKLVDGLDGTLNTVGELLVALIDRLGRLLPPPQR
jgi:hypothetical protein